jgi:uncharacterized integral membrane protein
VSMRTGTKVKLVFAAVLLVLAVIVVLQNTETVETRILHLTLTLPRAALLFGAVIVGFVVGKLTTFRRLL